MPMTYSHGTAHFRINNDSSFFTVGSCLSFVAMLYLGLSSSLRYALRRNVAEAVMRPRAQPFSMRAPSNNVSNIRSMLQSRPTILSPTVLSRFSRAITTDAHTITPSSSQEAWKRFGITAVMWHATITLLSLTHMTSSGCCRRHCHPSRRFTEQRYTRYLDSS